MPAAFWFEYLWLYIFNNCSLFKSLLCLFWGIRKSRKKDIFDLVDVWREIMTSIMLNFTILGSYCRTQTWTLNHAFVYFFRIQHFRKAWHNCELHRSFSGGNPSVWKDSDDDWFGVQYHCIFDNHPSCILLSL